jgi:hypothetical protein
VDSRKAASSAAETGLTGQTPVHDELLRGHRLSA